MSSNGGWKKKAQASHNLDSENSSLDPPSKRSSTKSASGKKSLNLVCSQSDVDSSPISLTPNSQQSGSSPSPQLSSSSSSLKKRKSEIPSPPNYSSSSEKQNSSTRKWTKKTSPSKYSKIIHDEDSEEESEEEEVKQKYHTPPKKKSKHSIVVISDDETDDEEKPTKKSTKTTSSGLNWCEKYAPSDVSELRINDNILSEFENWICDYPNDISRFDNKPCIVIGPGGAGKRSMVYLMIKKHFGFGTVHIYHPNKINKDDQREENELQFDRAEDFSKGPNPNAVISNFREFLRTTIVKKSLNFSSNINDNDVSFIQNQIHDNNSKQQSKLGRYNVDIIVVEELPPVHTKQQKEKLYQALNHSLTLLQELDINKRRRIVKLIVLSDHTNSSTADYDLVINFPKEFRESSKTVKVIKPAKTKIKEILTAIAKKEKLYSRIGNEDFEEIAMGCNFDLRHAILQLEYFSLGVKHGTCDLFSSPVKTEKTKKVEKQAKKILDSINRKSKKKHVKTREQPTKTSNVHIDAATTIHHAAARVLYGKRHEQSGNLEFNLEKDVLDLYKSEKTIPEQTLTNYIQSNAPHFCTDITALSKSLDAFSHSDSSFGRRMNNNYEDTQQTTTFDEYQFLTTSRSVLYYHQDHQPKRAMKHILAPKLVKSVFKQREEKLKQLLLLLKTQDQNEEMITKAYLGILPTENISTFSNLFNLKDTLDTLIPYLVEMLKKPRQISTVPTYLNIREIHNYPQPKSKDRQKSLSSSDDVETLGTEADDTINFSSNQRALAIRHDMSQSTVSALVSYLTMGMVMSESSVFLAPKDDEITDKDSPEEEDEIEDAYMEEILDILEAEAQQEDE